MILIQNYLEPFNKTYFELLNIYIYIYKSGSLELDNKQSQDCITKL